MEVLEQIRKVLQGYCGLLWSQARCGILDEVSPLLESQAVVLSIVALALTASALIAALFVFRVLWRRGSQRMSETSSDSWVLGPSLSPREPHKIMGHVHRVLPLSALPSLGVEAATYSE